jgi:hypothetical protein
MLLGLLALEGCGEFEVTAQMPQRRAAFIVSLRSKSS